MIIGHTQTTSDLKRLVDTQSLGHAYLFHGPSMVGKRTLALALANYLEYGNFSEPEKILQDALLISPEGSSAIGIYEVRRIKGFLWQKPIASPRRTLIVDRAELMSEEAQNAILKIAEEPPPSSLLILIAGDIESLRETITSRLAKIYFSTVEMEEVAKWLEKERGFVRRVSEEAAAKSHGKPGLAIAMFSDKRLQGMLKSAEVFLKTVAPKRRDFIKKLIEPEDFGLPEFLDALILLASSHVLETSRASPSSFRVSPRLWHKVLELRDRSANFALNPRLQLEALVTSL